MRVADLRQLIESVPDDWEFFFGFQEPAEEKQGWVDTCFKLVCPDGSQDNRIVKHSGQVSYDPALHLRIER